MPMCFHVPSPEAKSRDELVEQLEKARNDYNYLFGRLVTVYDELAKGKPVQFAVGMRDTLTISAEPQTKSK